MLTCLPGGTGGPPASGRHRPCPYGDLHQNQPPATLKWAWCSRGVHIFKKVVFPICFENPRSPLGPPHPLLRPRRTTQPTVVISVRSASLFGIYGPGAREGCTFSRCLFLSIFQKIHATVVFSVPLGVRGPLRAPSGRPRGSPWGSHGRFYGHDEQRSPPS